MNRVKEVLVQFGSVRVLAWEIPFTQVFGQVYGKWGINDKQVVPPARNINQMMEIEDYGF